MVSTPLSTASVRPYFRRILPEDEALLMMAGAVHSAAWQEAHRALVTPEFLALHTPERQTAFFQGELSAGKELYGAFFGDSPAGVVVVDPKSGEISSLYVLPSRWDQGVGSALLAFSKKRLSVLGKAPWLGVLNANERARRFYEKRGFAWSGESVLLDEQTDLRELRYVPVP